MYPETKPDREWYELDDFTERIHDSEEKDDQSPHDPEVVDAPEDMKRVGNDHEDLHNAKLSPDGYYNGFHHKDYEGKFVQKARRGSFAQRPHHRHNMVQLSDHENDADDILETDRDFSYVQDHDNDPDDVLDENSYVHTKYEHEDDTEDIPDGVNPINQELLFTKMQDHGNDTNDVPDEEASTLIGTSGARGSAMRRMDNEKAWDNFYKAG